MFGNGSRAPGSICPLLNKTCIEHACAWYIQLKGTNKNTGDPVDNWGCTMSFLPVLMIEGNAEARHVAASVESMRNENIKGEDATRQTLMAGFSSLIDRYEEQPLLLEQGGQNGRP